MAVSRIYRSNGEDSARAYAVCSVPAFAPAPVEPDARVIVGDPSLTATLHGGPVSSGPRNVHEKVWPRPRAPAIQMPDARPLHKAQRFIVDPDLLTEPHAEANTERA
jgi:hypothetical protein